MSFVTAYQNVRLLNSIAIFFGFEYSQTIYSLLISRNIQMLIFRIGPS